MKKQLDKIDKNAEVLMGKKEISSGAKQKLQTAVQVCMHLINPASISFTTIFGNTYRHI